MSGTAPLIDTVAVGQLLLGKYRVESYLGLGGMGVVAQCMHIALNERVAIKMMRQDVTADPGAIERFIREAQAAAKLKSEYVARVSDVGSFDDGTHYMVMEYLEGYDLGRLLEQRGRLPVGWATELVLQATEALSEAHSLNIVHRDVKPTNLFLTWRPDGTSLIKVLDFGVSKVYGSAELRLTNTQSLLGTPAYMSPEQMRSARNVDPRTDIWALGVVLYELIEGHRPFEAESFTELCVKVSIDAPLPMETAPPELQRIVMRCLEKNPEQRYASMYDLGCELLPFVKNEKEGVIIVERMERMQRRWPQRASTTPAAAELPTATPEPARAPSVDMHASSTDKKWPDVTPTTEPDARVAELVAQAIASPELPDGSQPHDDSESHGHGESPDDTEPLRTDELLAPSPVPAATPMVATVDTSPGRSARTPTPRPGVPVGPNAKVSSVVAAQASTSRVAEAESESDAELSHDDTVFEVGSTHVPFSDRRADDLAKQPLTPLVSAKLAQPERALPAGGRSAARRPPRASPARRGRRSGWLMSALLIVAMMVLGGLLGYLV